MMFYKKTLGDRLFDAVVCLLVICSMVVTLYPLIYVVSMSISDPIAATRGDVWLYPVGFDLAAMKKVLDDPGLWVYYSNTIWYTLVGTACGIVVTTLAAYPLSRKEFAYRGFFNKFVMITMFFNGGIIPTYLVVSRNLGLSNNRWVIVILALTTAWYIMITKSFFASLPDELVESARLDGASELRTFIQVILPLSKPILAVLALYQAVGHWNSYFNHQLYLTEKKLHPLSLYIRKVVMQNDISNLMGSDLMMTADEILSSLQVKYAVIVVSVLPMLIIYPFISRYLEKGLMIGAVKG